jgi:iron complex outermembrane recepter protein
VALTSKRDSVEAGVYARTDTIVQRDTRIQADGQKLQSFVDSEIDAVNIAAYADASLYPWKRLVLRGGSRVDSLSYDIHDKTNNQGLERTAQGFHIGNKVTADYAAGGGVHLIASYGEGFRSPQVRDLREGDRVPFAKVRSVEGGMKWNDGNVQTSVVGFGSWLQKDRVFEATERRNVEAPPSTRVGASAALTMRAGPFGSSASVTYARAWFTASDARFQENMLVPYAPAVVVRNDAFLMVSLGRFEGRHVMGRLGLGFEGVAGRPLPGGRDGKNVVYADGVAAVGWHWLELAFTATNLLGLGYYDAQYVYASNFDRNPGIAAPAPHVLVAPPTTFFLTLQVHLRASKEKPDRTEASRKQCLERAKNTADEESCFE